jgi:hypothetical protein
MPNNVKSEIHTTHHALNGKSAPFVRADTITIGKMKVTDTKLKTLINPTKEVINIDAANQLIKPNETYTFNVNLKGKPQEMIIYGFQWINEIFGNTPNEQNNTVQLGKTIVLSNLSTELASLYIDIINGETLRFFQLEDEYNNGTLLNIERYESVNESGIVLGYPSNSGGSKKSFFANNNLEPIDGKIVVKNISIQDNILSLQVQNQGTSDVVLSPLDSIHNVPITNNTSLMPRARTQYDQL